MTHAGHTPAGAPAPASDPGPGRTPHTAAPLGPLTVGVEEEFLLVDPVTRELRAEAEKVVAEAAPDLGDRVGPELTRYQVETRTDPHTRLADLADQIRSTRHALAQAAARQGLRIVSSGTPVLVALSANSPYWAGRDTGYASWRTTTWGRWPVSGPPPYFESSSHFEDLVAGFLATGTVLDRGGLYWDIRPSHHLPTLEFRAADATATPDDTVLLAGIVRALTATALTAVRAGERPPRPSPELLRAACWHAARDGITGLAVDPDTGRLTPAAAQVDRLLARLRPALHDHGDSALVHTLWSRLRTEGSRAEAQRAAHHRRGHLTDVVDHLIATTAPRPSDPRP
ncbi:glutamate-cysteine ligase family protein [Streptomyces sp. WAC06614]|uniref:carboxylate-amine ligase n=1 Tax=Streptomyces sp. WAC06614 TaxID=2487416 RepID=UPI000F7AF441|nr:glutamate-cysteine ligase family protein [Streptomyces sp. WAC06614]RSS83575.1 glutamate--cysteine ligase [Streptomyces sp. WAC06614]